MADRRGSLIDSRRSCSCLGGLPERVGIVVQAFFINLIMIVVGLVQVVTEGELLAEIFFLVAFRLGNKLVMVFHLIHW